jgi:hypothetical protein
VSANITINMNFKLGIIIFFKSLFCTFEIQNKPILMNTIKNYIQENKERFINELIELLKIPSVSADTAYSQMQ